MGGLLDCPCLTRSDLKLPLGVYLLCSRLHACRREERGHSLGLLGNLFFTKHHNL